MDLHGDAVRSYEDIDRSDQSRPRPITPQIKPPARLSIAWLLQFDHSLANADRDRLGSWRQSIESWSPVLGSMAGMLIHARLQALEPPEFHPTEITDQVIAQLARFFDGTRAQELPELTGKHAQALLEALQSERPLSIFEIVHMPHGRVISNQDRMKIFSRISDVNPVAAVTLAQQLENNLRRDTLPLIFGRWASDDLKAASDWVLTVEPGRERNQLGQRLLVAGVKDDPLAALTNIKHYELIGFEVHDAQAYAVSVWAGQDPGAAEAWIQEQPHAERFARSALSSLAREDPKHAVEWLGLVPESQRPNSVSFIVNQWMEKEPEAAMAWARGLEDPGLKTAALSQAASSLAQTHPEEAWNLLQEVMIPNESPTNRSSLHLITNTLTTLEREQPGFVKEHGALEQLLAMIPGHLPSEIIQSLASSDPAWIAEIVTKHSDLDYSRFPTNTMVETWVDHDPAAAANWVAGIEDETLAASAQSNLVSHWAQSDPAAAAEWVSASMGPGASKWNNVQASIASAWISRRDYEQALRKVESMTSDSQLGFFKDLFGTWVADDPLAAREALDKVSLEPEDRASIEKVFSNRPNG